MIAVRLVSCGHTLHCSELERWGPELVANHPITTLRILVDGPASFAKLATLPWLAKIPAIEIEGRAARHIHCSSTKLRPSALAGASLFATTTRLTFVYADDGDAEWKRFLAKVRAPKLEAFACDGNFKIGTFELFADKRLFPSLRWLELSCPIGNKKSLVDVMTRIAKRPLVHVGFDSSWRVDDATFAKCVAGVLSCKTVTSLRIESTMAGEQTIAVLREHGGRLRRLWFSANQKRLTDEDMAALANARITTRVE